MNNCTNIEGKISPSDICKRCGFYWQKTCWGYRRNFKFCTHKIYLVLKKTPQNNFFLRGPHHGENGIWNIWRFAVFFILSKYLMCCSETGVQLVLTCLCSAIVLSTQQFHKLHWVDSINDSSMVYRFKSSIKKVRLHPNCNPNIFSEIIELPGNEGTQLFGVRVFRNWVVQF